MLSYKSMWVGGLKCGGNYASIISSVKGWFSFRQDDCGQEAYVSVMFMIGWNGLYSLWDGPSGS